MKKYKTDLEFIDDVEKLKEALNSIKAIVDRRFRALPQRHIIDAVELIDSIFRSVTKKED